MASPAPAKSQPLHNFSLPHHLTWKTNHTSAAVDQQQHHHHRSRTRISTPPPPPSSSLPAVPSSSSNTHRASHHFDPPRRQSSPSSTFGARVSRGHSPLLDSLPKQSPLRESESESDFRRKRSPASSSRRQTSPSYSRRRHSPLLDSNISKQSPVRESESESDFSSAAATLKSPVPEYTRSDLPLSPSLESKSTPIDPEVALSNEKRKRSKISIRFGKNKLDENIPDEDQEKSTAPEGASADATAEDEESVPKTWNLRPRRPINKQSNVNGNVGVHKHGGSLSKELRSAMSNDLVGINPVEKKEKKMDLSISLSLSRSEIEEDIYALTGSKPSRRPKKRTKTVQRQIETILPGMWLSTINADSYKVSEAPLKV